MELFLGILLLIGLLTCPAALVAFLSLRILWVTAFGTSWIWELLVPVLASLALAVGRDCRALDVDASLRRPPPRPRCGVAYRVRPWELLIILAPIIEGRADITLGSRFGGKSNPGALPWHQSFGNRLAAALIRLLYGVKIRDLGPFRAGRADVLRSLALEETTYGWAVEMIVKGAIAGFRIVEVSVSYSR